MSFACTDHDDDVVIAKVRHMSSGLLLRFIDIFHENLWTVFEFWIQIMVTMPITTLMCDLTKMTLFNFTIFVRTWMVSLTVGKLKLIIAMSKI